MFVGIFFIFFILGFILMGNSKTEGIGGVLSFCSGIFIFIFVLILGCTYMTAGRDYAVKQEEYNALVYKIENTEVQDNFNFVGKEIIDEVSEWNKEIREAQYWEDDFWFGIFWPEFWNELELIDYNIYQRSQNENLD